MSPRSRPNPSLEAFLTGRRIVERHPVVARLAARLSWLRNGYSSCPSRGWLVVSRSTSGTGSMEVHPTRLADPEQWAHVLTRGLLTFGMGLWRDDHGDWEAWSAACDIATARLAHSLRIGRAPQGMAPPSDLPAWDEERWYTELCATGVPDWARELSLAGPGAPSMLPLQRGSDPQRLKEADREWALALAEGLSESVGQAVEMAAGLRTELGLRLSDAPRGDGLSPATRAARDWFVTSFPLLGSMVAAFTINESREVCRREEIAVAAVDEVTRTIYLNPTQGLSVAERRFVIAHEVLHVALRHSSRQVGRDPRLWNAACDFVINDWLIQMQVGVAPSVGLLFDPELRGLSAEEVYDRLVRDIRRMRRLRTMAGSQSDVLDRSPVSRPEPFTDLDAFCRDQLGKGLMLHQQQGRGLLPAGLLEEINAVLQPPIPWEVELARWFDHHFPPLETRRTWARPSRRQSSSPDIPRPARTVDPVRVEGRTFGVVLDTSGSMDRRTLARALGAIASYAEAKEVPAVRVVCCDAAPYDLGYLAPAEIAGRVRLRGRGGTVLQPGIRLLETAADFPADGPLLIITDGQCDAVSVAREHAFLLPPGRRLPFAHRGEVFQMS